MIFNREQSVSVWFRQSKILWPTLYYAQEFYLRWRHRLWLCLFVLLLVYLGRLSLVYVKATQPLNFAGAAPEQILELTAAKNFVKRGFFKELLLVDYATSTQEEDHPYLYTHQPSAPAILLGILLKCGLTLFECRVAFVIISLLGVVAFFFLILRITKLPEVAWLTTLVCFYSADGWIEWSDHFVHSFSGVGYFGTILFYLIYVDKKSLPGKLGFLGCATAALVTCTNTAFPTVISICLIHVLFNRKAPNSIHLLRGLVGLAALIGVFLILRNCIVLGVEIATRDILYTIGNRIVGWPSKESLMAFYDANRIVLWGVSKVDHIGFVQWFSSAVLNPLSDFWSIIVCIVVAISLQPTFFRNNLRKAALIIVIFSCTYAWHVLFFAQGSIYLVPFVHKMFRLGLLVIVLDILLSTLPRIVSNTFLRNHYSRAKVTFGACALVFATVLTARHLVTELSNTRRNWQDRVHQDFSINNFRSFHRLRDLPQGAIFTNVDAIVINFFTENLVFGGCDEKAFHLHDASTCPSSFVAPETKLTAKPLFFLLTSAFTPGYQSCRGQCYIELVSTLRKTHQVTLEATDWIVFEISNMPQRRLAREQNGSKKISAE